MSQNISKSAMDLPHDPITVISVIASFDSEGRIKPLYVRIGDSALKVHSFYERRKFANQIEFICTVEVHDFIRPVELTFHQRECMWTIPRPAESDP